MRTSKGFWQQREGSTLLLLLLLLKLLTFPFLQLPTHSLTIHALPGYPDNLSLTALKAIL